MTRFAGVALAGLLAAACTLGPNYKRPMVTTPATFRGAPTADTDSLADLKWFELFRDDTLTELVGEALKQNFDLRIAAERVLQARAAYRITRADRFPTVDASAAANALRTSREGSARGLPAGANTDVSYIQAGFALGWEIDVWGRLRRLNEASELVVRARQRHPVEQDRLARQIWVLDGERVVIEDKIIEHK